jgi:hypothetical protein
MRVVHADSFFHDGRGPTLVAVHHAPKSAHLLAIDFKAPDSEAAPAPIQHLRFVRAQAFMFTPEEVENYETTLVNWGKTGMGALVSLGKSSWLRSFGQQHLAACEHFRVMFYDEYLDVICEQVHVKSGPYVPE